LKFRTVIAAAAATLFATAPLAAGAQTAKPAAAANDAEFQEKLALTKRYIAAIELTETLDSTLKAMMPMLLNDIARVEGLSPSSPKVRELQEAVTQSVLESAAILMPRYFDRMAEVYARAFSKEELEALVTFYDSEMGRSITAKGRGVVPDAAREMEALMPGYQADILTRLCKRYECSAPLKAQARPSST